MKRIFGLALALALGTTPGLWAQTAAGNVYGSVTDASGAVLPGASVTISSTSMAARSTTAGTQGDFRFLNLPSGTYKMSVALAGFATVNRDIVVTTGQNVNLTFPMKVATVEETVTVTAETPIVDTKAQGTSTTLTSTELEQVPQSKDPWAVLKTVPGVIVDRVNVAGNESGQQSGFASKGSLFSDTSWSLDGVAITDYNSNGASSSYFDMDAFEEVNLTTGGGDLKVQTGGLGINFVTKRGTNTFHGSVRGVFANHDLQWGNLPDAVAKTSPNLIPVGSANHTDQISDWGADIGGPILKDKLWGWVSYGKNDIRIVRFTQTQDKTILKNWNAKLNWQASKNDMVNFFWFSGAKVKLGRDPGVTTNEPNSFLWNQGNFYPESDCGISCGLHGLWKAEWNHTFSPSFFLNAKYAVYNWGYGFAPIGGTDNPGSVDFSTQTAYGSYVSYTAKKPSQNLNVDGNYFAAGWGGNHELKFGFGYRKNPTLTTTTFSGNQVYGVINGPGDQVAKVTRQRNVAFAEQAYSAYLGDSFTKGRATLNLGVRWDHQHAYNQPSTAEANPDFPDLLPALAYDGSGPTITWNNFSPRVSFDYALDESRKTVLRASYARYAGQLLPNDVTVANPVGGYSTFLAYKWIDRNGDHFAQKDELLLGQGIQYYNNVDPGNPTAASSTNRIDPNYGASHDNEVIVGIDRELGANMAVGMAYTWRKIDNISSFYPRIGMTSANYTPNAAVSQNGYTAQSFSPDPALIAAFNSGRIITNRQDYHTGYGGLEFTFTKRLSNKWMARTAFSFMNNREYIDGPLGAQNPTRTDITGGQAGTAQNGQSGPQVDGGQIAPKSGGSGKGDIFFNAKWQFVFNAMYQLPANFEIATSVFGRQGYAYPIVLRLNAGADGALRVLGVPDIDTNRYPDLWDVDFRLANNIKLGGRVTMQATLDLFNMFNSGTVLGQNRQANATGLGNANDLLAPRILRVGLRLQF